MFGEGFLSLATNKDAFDLIFPRNCLHCGDIVPEQSKLLYLCPDCLREIELFKPPSCRTCGFPFYGIVVGSRSCPHCKELDPTYNMGRTICRLDGPMRGLVHALKYRAGSFVLRDIVDIALMAKGIEEFLNESILVPVPLHPIRQWKRTFNQCELIAEELAERVSSCKVQSLLRRIRWTGSQTLLSRDERCRNMQDAFDLKRGISLNPDSRYVVVDDVFTTGSTLNACCSVLRRFGATNLDILALGHG